MCIARNMIPDTMHQGRVARQKIPQFDKHMIFPLGEFLEEVNKVKCWNIWLCTWLHHKSLYKRLCYSVEGNKLVRNLTSELVVICFMRYLLIDCWDISCQHFCEIVWRCKCYLEPLLLGPVQAGIRKSIFVKTPSLLGLWTLKFIKVL